MADSSRLDPVPLSGTSAPPWSPPKGNTHLLFDLLVSSAAACVTLWISRNSPSWMSPALATAVGGAAFAMLRQLPTLSHERLLDAEAALLRTVKGDLRHHWNTFTTASGASWHVHSLWLRPSETSVSDRHLPIVLIHGHSASSAVWESVLDKISGFATDVFVIDLPGWGRSPAPPSLAGSRDPELSTSLVLEMLDGWLVANGLHRIVLVGHSLGGFYSVLLAKNSPERVAHLILVAPAGLLTVAPSVDAKWGIFFKYLTPQVIARVFGRPVYVIFKWLYNALNTEDRRFPDLYYQLAAASAHTGAADQFLSPYLTFDMWGSAGTFWRHPTLADVMTLDVPVSVIQGQTDEIVAPITGPLIHRLRPHADLYIVRGAEHNPAHYSADAFCDAVGDCVRKHLGLPRVLVPHLESASMQACGDADRLLLPIMNRNAEAARSCHGASPAAAASNRGRCHGCGEAVCMDGARWRCGCGSWMFAAFGDRRLTRALFTAFVGFATSLYVDGTFNARDSACLLMRVAADGTLDSVATVKRAASRVAAEPGQSAEYRLPPSAAPFTRGDVFLVG